MAARDTETDASSLHPISYYPTLKDLGDNLLRKNVGDMKFLCRDFLPKSELEEINKAIDLFISLENVGVISPGNWPGIIPELLFRIRRFDLLRKTFKKSSQDVEQQLKLSKQKISPYRTMLFSLSEEITKSNFKNLKFMCNSCFSKKELNDIEDMQSLLIALEDISQLHSDKLDFLFSILKNCGATSAQHKLESFMGNPPEKNRIEIPGPVNKPIKAGPPRTFQPTFQPTGPESSQQPPSYNTAVRNPTETPQPPADTQPPPARTAAVPALGVIRGGGRGDAHPGLQESRYQNVLSVTQPGMQSLSGQTAVVSATVGYQLGGQRASGQPGGQWIGYPTRDQEPGYQFRGQGAIGGQRVSDVEVARVTHQLARMELPRYEMDTYPRGICVIINNRNFYQTEPQSKKLEDRKGTDVDREKLKGVFGWLGFKMCVYDNLDSRKMVTTLLDIARWDHSSFSCFICCILSHGESGVIYGSDGCHVDITDLTSPFKSSYCPGLAGKPKLFFMQSCQGTDRMGSDLKTDSPYVPPQSIPSEADYLLGLATVPGFVSFRSITKGSWYISALVDALHTHAGDHDLLSILSLVNDQVSRATANLRDDPGRKQVPAPLFTLRKQVFLTPPTPHHT